MGILPGLTVQQDVRLQQHEHLVQRLLRVVNTDRVINIYPAARNLPALRDRYTEIGGFVLFGFQ